MAVSGKATISLYTWGAHGSRLLVWQKPSRSTRLQRNRNNVFSDLTAKELLGPCSITDIVTPPDNETWRRGYYDKPRAWETVGPQAGDITELTRKFTTQKMHRSLNMPTPKRSLEEKMSAHARALSKASDKKRRQLRALHADSDASVSSSSSTSTSSSSEN